MVRETLQHPSNVTCDKAVIGLTCKNQRSREELRAKLETATLDARSSGGKVWTVARWGPKEEKMDRASNAILQSTIL